MLDEVGVTLADAGLCEHVAAQNGQIHPNDADHGRSNTVPLQPALSVVPMRDTNHTSSIYKTVSLMATTTIQQPCMKHTTFYSDENTRAILGWLTMMVLLSHRGTLITLNAATVGRWDTNASQCPNPSKKASHKARARPT